RAAAGAPAASAAPSKSGKGGIATKTNSMTRPAKTDWTIILDVPRGAIRRRTARAPSPAAKRWDAKNAYAAPTAPKGGMSKRLNVIVLTEATQPMYKTSFIWPIAARAGALPIMAVSTQKLKTRIRKLSAAGRKAGP